MRKASNPQCKRRSSRSHSHGKSVSGEVRSGNLCVAGTKCVATAGEVFLDAMIELVSTPTDSYRLNLLRWDGESVTVAPRIKHGRSAYEPIALELTVIRTVQWPERSIEYGSTRDLFERVLGLIMQHVGIPETSARLVTYYVFSTWFPDRLSLAPGLAILGPADSEGVQFLRLLRCLCRRSMLLTDVSQRSLLSLPLQLAPSLLINRPMLTRPLRSFLSTSNRRGLVAVRGGKLSEICCPKAVYFGMDEIPQDIASVMIQVTLSSTAAKANVLEDRLLSDITAELQGKMLAYRLANYSRIRISHIQGMHFTHQTSEFAINLAACIVEDAELAAGVLPLLEEQDDHVRGQPDRKLEAAILGAVLACLHEKKSSRAQVKEIAILANALLRSQGEIVEHTPEEVGHRLDGLSLPRNRQTDGMFLLLNCNTSRLVHRLALLYGVAWDVDSVAACPDCKAPEALAHSPVV